ncbi:hypothetical protein BFP97_13580 [Roseivirga sp. 4D4]|nr:hypothetical protein BFP97_13580 [Roseivirga sp. 4D4]
MAEIYIIHEVTNSTFRKYDFKNSLALVNGYKELTSYTLSYHQSIAVGQLRKRDVVILSCNILRAKYKVK